MHKIKKSVMALLLVSFAVAEIPESAHAAVVSPVAATPIASSQSEDGNLAKAAWRYCRRSYWGRFCGPWHYGYRYHYHRRYVWYRRY
jgi:hypothetical protein